MQITAERYFFTADFFSIIYYFVHHVLPFYIFILQVSQATLGDFTARPSPCDRGLPRRLSDHSSGTLRLNYMRLATRIQLGYSFSFRPCYKAHTSPSSKLGDYIGTMHLSVHLVSPVRRLDSQLNWEFFLDPGTMCLRHLLPGSGTKWAHFTLR